jgi:hypothetical protein
VRAEVRSLAGVRSPAQEGLRASQGRLVFRRCGRFIVGDSWSTRITGKDDVSDQTLHMERVSYRCIAHARLCRAIQTREDD